MLHTLITNVSTRCLKKPSQQRRVLQRDEPCRTKLVHGMCRESVLCVNVKCAKNVVSHVLYGWRTIVHRWADIDDLRVDFGTPTSHSTLRRQKTDSETQRKTVVALREDRSSPATLYLFFKHPFYLIYGQIFVHLKMKSISEALSARSSLLISVFDLYLYVSLVLRPVFSLHPYPYPHFSASISKFISISTSIYTATSISKIHFYIHR